MEDRKPGSWKAGKPGGIEAGRIREFVTA